MQANRLAEIFAPDFDLEKTLNSGQVFHWEKYQAGFAGTIASLSILVEQSGEILKIRCGQRLGVAKNLSTIVAHYFALDHPLAKICASFPNDAAMDGARAFCCGLRLIRQPVWECLATFICSSMKQVAHIRQISLNLRCRFGRARPLFTTHIYDFPSARRLAQETEVALRQCGLGYRAKNLLATARLVADGDAKLEAWRCLPDEELRSHLCALPGVGPKVANCAMLFAYERITAFPIDVWIERVLRQSYFQGKKRPTATALARFAGEYFGPHGGYAQQYLFHHARSTNRRGKKANLGETNRRRSLPQDDMRAGAQ
ncbi:MAG: DNA glycosylase [Verrucomicrobiota bacterium]